jgi:RNA polymerase sigma factor (sigma-70 family)
MANPSTRVLFRTVQTLTHSQVSGLSDRELLQRFVSEDDQTAFAAIVTRHSGMVLGVCRRTLSSIHDAEDACQAVFLLLAKKAGNTKWRSSVANWLYTTARNVADNARTASVRRQVHEGQVAVPEAITPVDSMTVGELSAILDEELDKLPPRYREPLVLCYLEGLTRDEAATQLAIPEATLKSQLERGRKKLADALTSRGCTLGMTLLVMATTFRAIAASPKLLDSILASLSGKPSASVSALLNQVTGKGILTKMKFFLLSGLGLSVLVLGLATAQSTSTSKEKFEPKSEIQNQDHSAIQQLGSTKFRADAPIKDARYSADGKKIVGHVENILYIWDAQSGELLRKIDPKLESVPEPTIHPKLGIAFAVHPKVNQVVCGGIKEGKTILQIWDFDNAKLLVEKPSSCDALKLLVWTPDGKRLLERSNIGLEKETPWKLIVRNDQLEELHIHDLPESKGTWSPVTVPLPNNKEALVWQKKQQPILLDLESGKTVLTMDYLPQSSSDVAISPDGKHLLLTSIREMFLYELPSGKRNKPIPVLRKGWEKPRPMFSPDSKTIYVWDHRPMAYEVATGKQLWQAVSPALYGVAMRQHDLSSDGSTILFSSGNKLGFLDTKTGHERNMGAAPGRPASMIWSPDGKILFTRVDEHAGEHKNARERTWTAWEVATGKQRYYLQPTHLKDDNWKMLPDLFFMSGGKEILVGIELTNSHESSAAKELVVFDIETGKQKRLFCPRLPLEEFRWVHPIGIDEKNSIVLMQAYAIPPEAGLNGGGAGPRVSELKYPTFRWDSLKQKKLQEWKVEGDRTEISRYYHPYNVSIVQTTPIPSPKAKKLDSAKIRCYSLTDGKMVHELPTEFSHCNPDRIEGNFLLTESYNTTWIKRGSSQFLEPVIPIAYEYWELPSREKICLFEQEKKSPTALGPKGEICRSRRGQSFV